MARNFGKFLLVLLLASACRRQSAPPPGAAVAPSPAPLATGSPEPKQGAVETPPATTAETAEKKAADVESTAGRRAVEDGTAPSPAATGAPETAKRKSAARAAVEQQRPAAKQRGARPQATKAQAKQVAAASSEVAAPDEKLAAAAPSPEPTAHATLRFKNDAGETYKLVEARFVMDGAELPTVLKGGQRGQTQQVFAGELAPGRHVIASRLTYQGADRAVFTYMKGYIFKVKSDDIFVARGAEPVAMTIICKEKTGFNEPVEKRLFVTVE